MFDVGKLFGVGTKDNSAYVGASEIHIEDDIEEDEDSVYRMFSCKIAQKLLLDRKYQN